MSNRIDVAVVSTHVAPALGYGGVSVTTAMLTGAWAKLGHRIALCSSDASLGARLQAKDVNLGGAVEVSLYRSYGFRRWGFGLGAIPKILRVCRSAPQVYIHGIATWPSTLAALFCWGLGRPFVVAPHGGLMPEHVDLIRRTKPHKWWYYRLLTLPALRRAQALHCTSEIEAEGVRRYVGSDVPVVTLPNGVDLEQIQAAPAPHTPGLTLCFLGHILPEKGINAFLRVWLSQRTPGDRMLIAGRATDGAYFEEFKTLVATAPEAVSYHGYLNRAGVQNLLAQSHFLVLPSGLDGGGMRENFGNVVAEALAAGRPVLVARGLAWDGIEAAGAGLVFDLNPAAVGLALSRAQTLEPDAWRGMSRRARRYVEERLDVHTLAAKVWRLLVTPQAPHKETQP